MIPRQKIFILLASLLFSFTTKANPSSSTLKLKIKQPQPSSFSSPTLKSPSFFLGTTVFPGLSTETKKTATSTNFLLGVQGHLKSSKLLEGSFNWELDGKVFYAQAENHIYFDAPDFYFSFQPTKEIEWTVGRKKISWNLEDNIWHRGLWAPRNFYNLTNSMDQSLTGFYLQLFKKSKFSITAFASPIFIPDLGVDFQEKNNSFESKNPNFKPPGKSVALVGDNEIELRYRLVNDSVTDILFHPSAVLKLDANFGGANWSLATARKPMNQIPLRAPIISLKDTVSLVANVTPDIVYHTLVGFDVQKKIGSKFKTGLSVNYDQPDMKSQPPTTLQKNLDETFIYSGFLEAKFPGARARGLIAYSHINGGDLPDLGKLSSRTDSRFPLRFQYNRTVKLRWEQGLSLLPRMGFSSEINYDFIQKTAVSLWSGRFQINRKAQLLLNYSNISLLSQNFSDPREMYWHSFLDTDAFDLRFNYAF